METGCSNCGHWEPRVDGTSGEPRVGRCSVIGKLTFYYYGEDCQSRFPKTLVVEALKRFEGRAINAHLREEIKQTLIDLTRRLESERVPAPPAGWVESVVNSVINPV